MTLRDGRDLVTWKGGLIDPANPDSVSTLYRCMWVVQQLEAEGIPYRVDEIGRPEGVEVPDRQAGRDDCVTCTASGISTMWFQFGQMEEGYTPSAIDPRNGLSQHTLGRAIDIWTANRRRQHELFNMVGMDDTVGAIEPWHEQQVGNPAGWIDFRQFDDEVAQLFGLTPKPQPKQLTTLITRRRR